MDSMKTCTRCKIEKPLNDFYSDKKSPDGKSWNCKTCCKEKSNSNPRRLEHARRASLKRLYGITPEDYDSMFESQGGVCYVCKTPPGTKRLDVDHCHDSGAIRKLLCCDCNNAIARAMHSPSRLRLLAVYLEEHGIDASD